MRRKSLILVLIRLYSRNFRFLFEEYDKLLQLSGVILSEGTVFSRKAFSEIQFI